MPVEDNKQAVRRFYDEVINGRTLDALDELLTPDGVHDVIAEGDLVAARVTYTGTHQGEFVGIPATGRKTTPNGVHFFRMQDGRQAERGVDRTCSAFGTAGRHARTGHTGARHAHLAAPRQQVTAACPRTGHYP